MFAGRLRHKIDIATIAPAQDDMGGSAQSATVVYVSVPASIEALTGTEKFAAHEFVSQASHQIVIRYIGASPSWAADNTYQLGALCIDANGNWQQAQGNGLSGAAAPVWNGAQGGFTADGAGSLAFQWKNLGTPPPSTGVVSKMVALFQNRQFQITTVLNPDERNKMLILLCVEINDFRYKCRAAYPGDLT